MTHSSLTTEPEKMYGMLAQADMTTSVTTMYFTCHRTKVLFWSENVPLMQLSMLNDDVGYQDVTL